MACRTVSGLSVSDRGRFCVSEDGNRQKCASLGPKAAQLPETQREKQLPPSEVRDAGSAWAACLSAHEEVAP